MGSVFDAVNDSHDFVNDSRSASPTPSLASNRSVFLSLPCKLKYIIVRATEKSPIFFFGSSLSGRQLCNGITKTGKACKKRAVPGQEYCRVHEGGHSSYVHS